MIFYNCDLFSSSRFLPVSARHTLSNGHFNGKYASRSVNILQHESLQLSVKNCVDNTDNQKEIR